MTPTTARRRAWGWTAVLLLAVIAPAARADGEVKVTVIAILASSRHNQIAPELKCLAEKMREQDDTLTGFRAGRMTSHVLTLGREVTFPLEDGQSAVVILEPSPRGVKGTCLTVKTPGVGVVTYTIKCDKCFPIATPYRTKKGERLIVGFIVGPPDGKGPVKKGKP